MPVTALVTPGPESHQHHAHFPGGSGIGIGSVHRRLLVAYQDVLDLFLLEQLVVQGKDGTARVTENELDALFLKTANRDFGAGQFGGNAGVNSIEIS